MPVHHTARSTLLLLALPLAAAAAGCTTTMSTADRGTLDEILHRLDETSRQRTADAQRIEDLTRRIAVLETVTDEPAVLGPGTRDAAATDLEAETEPETRTPPPPPVAAEALPPLPVVRLAPVSEPPEGIVQTAQAAETRVAGAVAVQEAEGPEPDPLAGAPEDETYEGVGFGNDPGGGYLQFGAAGGRSTTVRLEGTPRPLPGVVPGTATALVGPAVTATGGTPSSAYGVLPRIPPMTVDPTLTAYAAPPVAAAPVPEIAPFDAGLDSYRAGRWQEAIGWFDRAVAQGVGDAQASQALFFKAEASFQLRNYLEALGLFERFVGRYPGHARAAEALLRTGMAAERLGDTERAAEMFRRVVDEHPASGAAAQAAERLEAAGAGGQRP